MIREQQSWFDQMRDRYGAPKIAPQKAPVKVTGKPPEESGFKINPLVAGAAALLVPIFGAMA